MNVAAVPDANPLNLPAVRVFVAASYEISVLSTDNATPEAVEETFVNNGYNVPTAVDVMFTFCAVVAKPAVEDTSSV